MEIRGVVNTLNANYLKNRKVKTYVNGDMSNETIVNKVVPQGSLLGPLRYLLG